MLPQRPSGAATAACSDRAAASTSECEEYSPMTTTNAATAPSVVSGTTDVSKNSSNSLGSSTGATLAGNFQTFLTLLTTQLQNQNPLDPLDTNQFTQQLVQFAGVEQQLKSNDQLKALIAIEKNTPAAITITNSAGQTVYSGNFALTDKKASFVWDGKGNDGTQWPAGTYK